MQEYIDNTVATQQLDISTRLAALHRWQEEQKRLLDERQNVQRQMLGLEQRNMYQVLGLLHKNDVLSAQDTADDTILNSGETQNTDTAAIMTQPGIETMRCAYDQSEEQNQDYAQANGPVKPKRAYLRRGQGLKQRFKIDPEELRLDNLPRYKFANAHPQFRAAAPIKTKKNIPKARKEPIAAKQSTQPSSTVPALRLDLNEQRFQQLLIGAKNTCNSTPDLKSSYASTNSSVSPKVRFVELNSVAQSKGQSADDENSTEASPMTGMCWAKVLDTQQIKPMPMLQRRTAQIRVEDEENVSIFEMLEQKAREGNIDMNSSCIRAFMSRKEQRREPADDSDIVITEQMKEKRLQPEVCEVIDEDDDDDETENLGSAIDNASSSVSTLTPIRVGKTHVRVRFSDSNDTHEYTNETLTDGSTLHGTSNGGNVELFEQFKSALFQALDNRKSPADEQLTQELQKKAELVRQRLEELEVEISTFKEQNLQLMRLKQQHELEQAKCAQEHREAMEHVHDEKIQAEIYLHDERMKIEEERRKFEQQMRLQKSNMNTKEKKEIAALKQEVESLQLQLKQKEQAHVAAQARLRAQLRASEKEQRSFQDEIELLGKENKRLEQELIRIGRENNHKMLQEINRNIARLAPKVAPPATDGVDENVRRTKSLDATSVTKPRKRREVNWCKNVGILSQRNSLGKIKPAPLLQESDAADNSSDTDDERPTTAEQQSPGALATSKAPAESAANKSSEFKREIVNADGSKDIWYPNGNLKKISGDGMNVRMLYFNKDIKETDIRAGTVKYYYAESNTWHTTYLDGLEILEFPNGQTEHRHKDGIIEIRFPNNIIKIVDPNDAEKLEEWRYADGSHLVQLRNGDKILHLANGQKEIHTKLNKRREYPDGTVKLVYPDGSQETRYSNGRVRLKDKDGKLVMDTDYAKY